MQNTQIENCSQCDRCSSKIQSRVIEITTIPQRYSYRAVLCAQHRREIEDHFSKLVIERDLKDVKIFTRELTEDDVHTYYGGY